MSAIARPYRILVATELSRTGARALDRAAALTRLDPHPELHVLTVVEHGKDVLPPSDTPGFDDQMQRIRDALEEMLRERLAGVSPLPTVVTHVRLGDAAEEIVRLALELEADLVVVGTHGRRGVRRLFLGSVAERVVRLAPCPVLAVRRPDYTAMAGLPVPEPACTDCVAEREKTGGKEWWCEAHRQPAAAAHVYRHSSAFTPPDRVGLLW